MPDWIRGITWGSCSIQNTPADACAVSEFGAVSAGSPYVPLRGGGWLYPGVRRNGMSICRLALLLARSIVRGPAGVRRLVGLDENGCVEWRLSCCGDFGA